MFVYFYFAPHITVLTRETQTQTVNPNSLSAGGAGGEC